MKLLDQMNDHVSSIWVYRRSSLSDRIYDLITFTRFRGVEVRSSGLALLETRSPTLIPFSDIVETSVGRGLLFHYLQISTRQTELRLRGLRIFDATQLQEKIQESEARWWRKQYAPHMRQLAASCDWIRSFADPSRYIRKSVFDRWVEACVNVSRLLPQHTPRRFSQSDPFHSLEIIRSFLIEADQRRLEANKLFVSNALRDSSEYFDSVEGKPLTAEQRRSVVIDEDNNLVVAAAGSGKTSVIVAKTGWELKNGYRDPSELILLAFAKDAQRDLDERVKRRLGEELASRLATSTFHSLGLQIIAAATGRKPSISRVADDTVALHLLIKQIVSDFMSDPTVRGRLYEWFQEHFATYRGQHEFENFGQYWNYIRSNGIRSLQNEKLKSYEECQIANFLFLNGIKYTYEQPYEHDTATKTHSQYRPDFYLPELGIYIEHLALKGFGRTPSFIDRKKYLQSLRWKRNLHKKYGTTLIETYSCYKTRGLLTSELRRKLEVHGVRLTPINPQNALKRLEELGRIDDFTKLMATFLGHYKGGQFSEADLRLRVGSTSDQSRNSAFIDLFLPVYRRYEEWLRERGEIDFEDMIILATSYVADGTFKSPFGYIIVDEFQDISAGRAKLLQALAGARVGNQLFCVGDDWQSIYRFAGSDVGIMRDYKHHFGTSEQTYLSNTFRFPAEIAELASAFITRNPHQIPKSVKASYSHARPGVVVCLPSPDVPDLLGAILAKIPPAEQGADRPTVFLLGRYNRDCPDLKLLKTQCPHLDISFLTIHRSKGREAQYVVVLSMISDFPGFPNEREDDPVLNLVLASPENFKNAEERRLFYVAITRAKNQVFLITDSSCPSTFISELITGPYDIDYFGRLPADNTPCDVCKEGVLQLRHSQHGAFFGCSNFPYCEYTRPSCPHCSRGLPKPTEDGMTCDYCGQSVERCPRKGCSGWLTLKNGKFGDFWGCTNFSASSSCTYTRKA